MQDATDYASSVTANRRPNIVASIVVLRSRKSHAIETLERSRARWGYKPDGFGSIICFGVRAQRFGLAPKKKRPQLKRCAYIRRHRFNVAARTAKQCTLRRRMRVSIP